MKSNNDLTPDELEALNSLSDLSESLIDEVHGLRGEVGEVDRRRKLSVLRLWVPTLLLIVAMFYMAGSYYRIEQLARANHHLQTENHHILTLIEDATNPKGKTYQQGQQATGDAVFQLICDNHTLHNDPHAIIGGRQCP